MLFDARLAEVLRGPRLALMRPADYLPKRLWVVECWHGDPSLAQLRLNGYPRGMLPLQVLGAVAQLGRALIAERTKAGLRAADRKLTCNNGSQ